jgi:hypothetical protein
VKAAGLVPTAHRCGWLWAHLTTLHFKLSLRARLPVCLPACLPGLHLAGRRNWREEDCVGFQHHFKHCAPAVPDSPAQALALVQGADQQWTKGNAAIRANCEQRKPVRLVRGLRVEQE